MQVEQHEIEVREIEGEEEVGLGAPRRSGREEFGQQVVNMRQLKETILRQVRPSLALTQLALPDPVSIQLQFITLLHLANEHHFHLKNDSQGNVRVA
jgi:hypothetical protein